MNKAIITALLVCTGLVVAGCEKNYSVAEFKKDKTLLEEWAKNVKSWINLLWRNLKIANMPDKHIWNLCSALIKNIQFNK
ncbi:EexN family lipoprotein [Bartonella sp. TT121SHDZB]|uniref:EexN family lipoprotein n=1 Tax=Bartonella sp. TT121SHDZB TaxID=3243580 RepID=UPI0035CF6262